MLYKGKRRGAGEGNRTPVVSLGSCCSTIELHPRALGVFEPTRPPAQGPANTHWRRAFGPCKRPAMNSFLLVAAGGAIGASLRHGAGLLSVRHLPATWPWATFSVNLIGGFAMGLVAGWFAFKFVRS